MQFTSATTIMLSTVFSILGATTEGAGVRGKANTPCQDVSPEIHCNHPAWMVTWLPGAGCTLDAPAFIHDNCVSPNYPVYYNDQQKDHQQELPFGSGWYCNDGKDVHDLTCNSAYIHTQCSGGEDGDLVNFNNGFWLCNN